MSLLRTRSSPSAPGARKLLHRHCRDGVVSCPWWRRRGSSTTRTAGFAVPLRRVLPLLLAAERGDVEGVPPAPHLLVAAGVDEVGTEDPVAPADERVVPCQSSTSKSVSKPSVIVYQATCSHRWRCFRPWISAWGARGEHQRRGPRVQVGGARDLVGDQRAAHARPLPIPAALGVGGDLGPVEGTVGEQLAAATEEVNQAHLPSGPVELVRLVHRQPRHPPTPGGERVTGAGQLLSFTSSSWRAASHACGDTIGVPACGLLSRLGPRPSRASSDGSRPLGGGRPLVRSRDWCSIPCRWNSSLEVTGERSDERRHLPLALAPAQTWFRVAARAWRASGRRPWRSSPRSSSRPSRPGRPWCTPPPAPHARRPRSRPAAGAAPPATPPPRSLRRDRPDGQRLRAPSSWWSPSVVGRLGGRPTPTTQAGLRRGPPPHFNKTGDNLRTAKGKGKEVTRSLPLSMYSAPGGLRQDPGRVAESPGEARTCGNQGFAKYVCSCRRVGLAGRRTAGGTRGAVAGTRRGGVGVRAAGLRGAAGRNATC
jgi:hypothetical protein